MAKDFIFTFNGFGGIDRRKNGSDFSACRDMANFALTKERGLEKREGYRSLKKSLGRPRGLWCGALAGQMHYFAVCSVVVYHSTEGFDKVERIGTLPGSGRVQLLRFGQKLYFLGGAGIRVYDPQKGYGRMEPYRPTLSVATTPEGVGTPYEEVNLLGGMAQQSFSPDGKSTEFKLALDNIDSLDFVKINGSLVPESEYTVDRLGGSVSFKLAPSVLLPDSVVIGFTKYLVENETKVVNCRRACVYGAGSDTAVFLWSNEDYPDVRCYSGLCDGQPGMEYFPELNRDSVAKGEELTEMVRLYDRLIMFTAEQAYVSYPESYTDVLGRRRVRYPIFGLSAAEGCESSWAAAMMEELPVTVSRSGICLWSSTAVRDEKSVTVISDAIDELLKEKDISRISLFYRKARAWLYVNCGDGDIFIYSPALKEYWCYKGLNAETFFESDDGELYFLSKGGDLCICGGSSDDEKEISAYWSSFENALGYPNCSKDTSWISLKTASDAKGRIKLSLSADVKGEELTNCWSESFLKKLGGFSFDRLDLSELSFITNEACSAIKKRARVKRFSRIAFKINACGDGALRIDSLSVGARIGDRRI
ncbi:MAG: hypothetical protein E7646_05955 [Ruminococcaceae bacterium]|nr:hypothetical protein [Oscillospiraceae bacterium]